MMSGEKLESVARMRPGHRIPSRLRTNRNKSNDAEAISSTVLAGRGCFALVMIKTSRRGRCLRHFAKTREP